MGLPTKVPVRLGPLFSFTVKLSSPIEKEPSFNTVCVNGHAPIRIVAPRTCPACGNKDGDTFVSGKEVDGRMVVVTRDELADAPAPPKEMVVTAHPLDQVLASTLPAGSVYLLEPSNAASVDGYSVLARVLEENPNLALIVEYAIRTAAKMWRISLYEGVLALTELAWPESVKEKPAVPVVEVADEVATMATTLVHGLEKPFRPEDYRNEAKAARDALIAEKLGDSVPMQPLPAKVPANVSTSLMDALRASVEAITPPAPAKSGKRTTPKQATKKAARSRKSA